MKLLTSYLVLAASAASLSLDATDFKPWFGPLEIDGRITNTVQFYQSVDTKCGARYRSDCGNFTDFSLEGAVLDQFAVELEAVTAITRHRSFGLDSLRLTGRYLWMNDIVDDPVSLTTGVTISPVFKPSRHDIAIFHHGGIEFEAHAAVGQETSCMQFWTSRWWGVGGIGIADQGYAWLRANLNWEHNWWDLHRIRLLVKTLWGLGHKNLHSAYHFKGYGSIRHQSIDLGFRYTYGFCYGIDLSVEYGYRVYSRNCPENVNFFIVELFYPIGL
jgi:hypothetical protein